MVAQSLKKRKKNPYTSVPSSAKILLTRLIRCCSTLAPIIAQCHVGNPATVISIHKDLLCQYSEFFRGALEGKFKEAEERKVNVPDVTPRTFAVFMSWLYTQTIKTPDDDEWDLKLDEEYKAIRADDANKPHSDQVLRDFVKRNEQAALFLRLYCFADEYGVPSLRQQVMQTWPVLWRSMSYRYLIRPSLAIEILERLPLSSALCQGLVYAYVYPLEGGASRARRSKRLRKATKRLPCSGSYNCVQPCWCLEGGLAQGLRFLPFHRHHDDTEAEQCMNFRRKFRVEIDPCEKVQIGIESDLPFLRASHDT